MYHGYAHALFTFGIILSITSLKQQILKLQKGILKIIKEYVFNLQIEKLFNEMHILSVKCTHILETLCYINKIHNSMSYPYPN